MFQERGSLSTNTGVAGDLLLEGVEVGAGGGDAGIGGGSDRVAGVGAGAHGAELDAAERAAVAPHARLHEKGGAWFKPLSRGPAGGAGQARLAPGPAPHGLPRPLLSAAGRGRSR